MANTNDSSDHLRKAINIRLTMIGQPTPTDSNSVWPEIASPLLSRQREIARGHSIPPCPSDTRIQQFLNSYLADTGVIPALPTNTLVLDQAGLARELSLPVDGDVFESELLKSYRLHNGVLHNPASDRRTTQGAFHIAEGGLSIPDDKFAVPKVTFARLLELALQPPEELMRLPYTANQEKQAACMVSLLMRPIVVPEVPGVIKSRSMETRFFAPGSLVSNLDFVEAIFGNGGDPYYPENDAALDIEGWTGHSGCVILAPHLVHAVKHKVGLPHWDIATERQRRDGMCWKDKDERYNNGKAFKLCARTASGVMVTIIADNYYGYCKKEVKTQISYSANLHGASEEEHSGGALVFPSFDVGTDYSPSVNHSGDGSLEEAIAIEPDRYEVYPEGYARDKNIRNAYLLPPNAHFSLSAQSVCWPHPENGGEVKIPFVAGHAYYMPNGYRIHMEPIPGERARWRMVGTNPEPTLCHKPSTVSGGGKSEISKAISDAILPDHVFVADFEKDMDSIQELLNRDYSERFRNPPQTPDHRHILSHERSIGSVIKLLSPSRNEFTDEYNEWLRSIPPHIKELLFVLKRYYQPQWGEDWRSHLSVDIINGRPANQLKIDGRKVVISSLRVGYEQDGSWRVFTLRPDFHPAAKIQMEDDITAGLVVPANQLPKTIPQVKDPEYTKPADSYKFVQNCENLLFQRPDDAIVRGYDKQAEADIASPGTFTSNYEPLTAADARNIMEDAVGFSAFSAPMQALIREAAEQNDGESPRYFVCTAYPRVINGATSKNTRYLQERPDRSNPRATELAQQAIRLHRKLSSADPVITPINIVVPGRRNNPPDDGVRPLCVFNPIHHMELPELFMEFISSMTGKSPSTTGAGSEGALTKGPFNAMPPSIDLNAALTSLILTQHDVFVTCAGYVGPKARVDHDISLLIPEIFSRMDPEQYNARRLIEHDYLEKLNDFEHNGRLVQASRLGYRITPRFVRIYCGRVFTHPHAIFTDEMLHPEMQDMDVFADSMENIVATHQRVAQSYFDDGSIEFAAPPLRALLHIMAYGNYEGKSLDDPSIRRLFTKEDMLESDWYKARLDTKQQNNTVLWRQHVRSLERTIENPTYADVITRMGLKERLDKARATLLHYQTPAYRNSLVGTLGTQPL